MLLAIATSPVIKKYGIDAILGPFLDDLQYLGQVSKKLSTQCNLLSSFTAHKTILQTYALFLY